MIDYNYYLTVYNGNTIECGEDFDSLLIPAKKYINSVTCTKGKDEEIAQGVCAVCDILYEYKDCLGIKSQSVDTIKQDFEDKRVEKLLYSALKMYLPKNLLYRGL